MKHIKLFENWMDSEYVTELPQNEDELNQEEAQVSEEEVETENEMAEQPVAEEILPGEESETGEGDVVIDEEEEE